MSEPISPEQAQAAAAQQLGQVAQTVGGTPSAGIYGDQAGASQPAPVQSQEQVAEALQAAGGKAADVDVAALLARLQALEDANREAAEAAAAAALAAEPKPPLLEEIVGALTGAAPGIVHAFSVIAERLAAAGL